MIDRSLDGMAFLSGQLGAMLRRRLREVGGIALISLAMMGALSLATWSVDDPSLSHATDARVHNLLGRPGAIVADLSMQLFGLGSLALLLPIAVWGYRLLGHRRLNRERLRVLFWLLGAVLAAAFASYLPRGSHWPLPSGLGGVIGDALLRVPVMVTGAPLTGIYRIAAAIVLGCAALAAFAGAAGMIWRGAPEDDEDSGPIEDDDGDTKGSIALGLLVHHLLSLRTRIARVFRRPAPASMAQPGAAPAGRRIEPRFGAPAEPQIDDDEPELEIEEPAAQPSAERKPRPAAKPRRSTGGYALPSINLLTAPRANERTTLERRDHPGKRHRARRRARRFRRARRDHQCAARAGGDAVRARARARHQIVARHQPRRRHRALDERAVGARRRGVGPQRHRHRTAEPDAARKSICASCSPRATMPRPPARLPLCLGKTIGGEAGARRSRAHAASAHRRHHRLRQIGRHQHHDPVACSTGCSPTSAG